MSVVRPMTEDEFVDWRPRHELEYAENMVDFGGIEPEAAALKAKQDFERMLTEGLKTDKHSLYTVDGDDGKPAGSLWLAEREDEQGTMLFVYDVNIDADRRGQGLGRFAMEFAADEARRRGIARVLLNVFGGNEIARNLYRSLGYEEMAVWMVKRV
jgi:ribosomal protein S18 acetylase RimI-like enzyme